MKKLPRLSVVHGKKGTFLAVQEFEKTWGNWET